MRRPFIDIIKHEILPPLFGIALFLIVGAWVVACTAMSGCSSKAAAAPEVIANDHAAALYLEFHDSTGGGDYCSGTAIGPHSILTAAHCYEPGMILKVAGQEVTISNAQKDSADHLILKVGMTFVRYAPFRPELMSQGMRIHMWGSPMGAPNLYREGVVMGSGLAIPNMPVPYVLDINGFNGDSGAGLFDERGNVVGVISMQMSAVQDHAFWHVMFAFPFNFSASQLAAI